MASVEKITTFHVEQGLVTVNEFRQCRGMPPVAGGDVFVVPKMPRLSRVYGFDPTSFIESTLSPRAREMLMVVGAVIVQVVMTLVACGVWR